MSWFNPFQGNSNEFPKSEIDLLLAGKVDKETGKSLSTNDYTTAEKTKLAGIERLATAVGKNVTGTEYVIDGTAITAREGAEIFNSYSSNKAIGEYSHAEGYGTTASRDSSHAEGSSTTASGSSSHAEGSSTTASRDSSHAEGSSTTASGSSSHAEGTQTTASGLYSHAEGSTTTASGENSHAEGYLTSASGFGSHTEGGGTIASSKYQHVQGKYNISNSNNKYAFIIGNGTSKSNRSNAFAIDWNGLIYQNNAASGVDLLKMKTIWQGTQEEYDELTSTNEYDFYCIYEEED